MASTRFFGTDGIRGPFGQGCMTEGFLRRLGHALATYLRQKYPQGSLTVQIGGDTRASTPQITTWLSEGLAAQGICVRRLFVVPTPAVSLAVRAQKSQMGIAITASHNPHTDNGVKLFDEQGLKLSKIEEEKIERLVDAQEELKTPADAVAPEAPDRSGANAYVDFARALLPPRALADWKIVVDTANGATSFTTPAVLEYLGASLITLNNTPDGTNINLDCGSEHPEKLVKKVVESQADLGIAHDGDGDRLLIVTREGALVDGDQLLGVLALHLFEKLPLEKRILVATVQSNLGLDRAIEKAGGKLVRVDVGDRNVLHKMVELGAPIGGENSGHIILADACLCGDGLVAALALCRVLLESRRPLRELCAGIPLFPQGTANLKVAEKIPLENCPALSQTIQELETELSKDGRVMARYSGTEPKLRLLVEADTQQKVDTALERLKAACAQDLSVVN